MYKQQLGSTVFTFPMPVVLVGAMVHDKVNFLTASWCSVVCLQPAAVSIAINTTRYTFLGIQQHKVFSLNIPTVDLVQEVDYCGIYSGRKIDKTKVFQVFYGTLATAPLIKECPLNLECTVVNIVNIGHYNLVIGTIMQTHAADIIVENMKVNPAKIPPLIYIPGSSGEYHTLGKPIAQAFSVGTTKAK